MTHVLQIKLEDDKLCSSPTWDCPLFDEDACACKVKRQGKNGYHGGYLRLQRGGPLFSLVIRPLDCPLIRVSNVQENE